MLKRIAGLFALLAWAVCAVSIWGSGAARAQEDGGDLVFIQVQAQPSRAVAEGVASTLTGDFANVAGFALGSGWYGIALGPYTRAAGTAALADLVGRGQIPPDAYLQDAARYGEQIWPLGAVRERTLAQARDQAADAGPVAEATTPSPGDGAPSEGENSAADADRADARTAPQETPAEARRSERTLTRAQREELQRALEWAGVYSAGIDGAFGRGTRAGMSAWQERNGHDVTGVLTTRQRAQLLAQFYAVFDGLGLERVADPRTGIAMELPTAIVAFDRYEAPFALYEPTGDLPVRVLQISQPGDRASLGGLYEIMQTLEIVPVEGPRQRRGDGFSITGIGTDIVSQTEVTLRDGRIKGFTLVWPTGDEDRRQRVLDRMAASVTRIDGVLDPARISDEAQGVDLVSGLQVRTPNATASGFFVDDDGRVLTSAAAVSGCGRVTLDTVHEARVAAVSAQLGLALLEPTARLAPRRVAQFRIDAPRLQSDVAVAGYPFGGVLGAPTLTYGRLAELQGLGGEQQVKRLDLEPMPGDAGGPVMDSGGTVLGLLQPRDTDGARRLPDDVTFATRPEAILEFLETAGLEPIARGAALPLPPEDLTAVASDMTVLVSCWD